MPDNLPQEIDLCRLIYPEFTDIEPLYLLINDICTKADHEKGNYFKSEYILSLASDILAALAKLQPSLKSVSACLLSFLQQELSSKQSINLGEATSLYQQACAVTVNPGLTTIVFTAILPTLYGNDSAKSSLDSGLCPTCQTKPHYGFHHSQDGKKHLECWLCSTRWTYPRLKCPYCANTDSDSLGYFTLDSNETCRIHYCKKCGHYHKVFDFRQAESIEHILPMHNIASLKYDYIAMREGLTPGSGLWYAPE